MGMFDPSATPKALPAWINSWCGTKVRHIFAPCRRTPHCDDAAAPRAKPRRAAFIRIRPAANGVTRGARPNEAPRLADIKIGRASCRERVCQDVSISVVDVSLQKKTPKQK